MGLVTQVLNVNEITKAVDLLRRGEIVAFPTETVYGLGASIFQPQAIAKIFQVKGRPQDNPLIAHVSHFNQIDQIAQDIPSIFYLLAEVFFPGPLTIVLKRKSCVPDIVSAGLDSIALRMPDHSLACALIEELGEPIVAPSANISGKPSSTNYQHVLNDFSGKIAAVINGGKTQYGIESTVISLIDHTPVLLRPGAISAEMIEHVIKRPLQHAGLDAGQFTPASPGIKYRHYAPQSPITLFNDEAAFLMASESNAFTEGYRMLLSRKPLSFSLPSGYQWFPLCTRDFYDRLRYADESQCESIAIICDGPTLQNLALMNRILKASGCV